MTVDGHLDVDVESAGVEFAFEVENAGTTPVTLTFDSGFSADVAVYADGEEVWRWSEGRMFTQAVESRRLDPGERTVYRMSWSDPPPGEYTAEATLAARGAETSARTDFRV